MIDSDTARPSPQAADAWLVHEAIQHSQARGYDRKPCVIKARVQPFDVKVYPAALTTNRVCKGFRHRVEITRPLPSRCETARATKGDAGEGFPCEAPSPRSLLQGAADG